MTDDKEKKALALLLDIKEVFEQLNITFWIRNGTLLGAVREKKFIPWDGDIDLGVNYLSVKDKNIRKKITDTFEEKGISTLFLPYNNTFILRRNDVIPVNVRLFDLNDVKVLKDYGYVPNNKIAKLLLNIYRFFDLECYGAVKSNVWSSSQKVIINMSIIPMSIKKTISKISLDIALLFKIVKKRYHIIANESCFKSLGTIKFYDYEFNVPADVEDYLAKTYGDDWHTPKKDFVYKTTIEEIK